MPEVRDSHYRAFASEVLTRFDSHEGFELALDFIEIGLDIVARVVLRSEIESD